MVLKNLKRGSLSPLAAGALLVLVAATAIFLVFYFTRGVSNEAIEKFGETAETACGKILFTPSFSGEEILVHNGGTIPLYAINLEIVKDGKRVIRFLRPKDGLIGAGESDSVIASAQDLSGNVESIVAVPVILGKSTSTGMTKAYTCAGQGKALL